MISSMCRRYGRLAFAAVLTAFLLFALLSFARADAEFKNYNQAMAYAKEHHPEEMSLGDVSFTPNQLLNLKNQLTGEKNLHFKAVWEGCVFSDTDKKVNLNKIKKTPSAQEIEAVLQVCAGCEYLNLYCSRCPGNKVMAPIAAKYPQVTIAWKVRIKAEYSLSSQATAFSTFIGDITDTRLNADDLEALKYCPNLRALDLGHNNLYNLEFLKYVPKLELLIVACNHLTDISPIGELEHLQYLELFTNKVTDLSPLANCKELIDLNISNTRITSLEALDGLQSLERMLAESCKSLPQEEKTRFEQLHPDCFASFSAEFVNTGWRTHPRYDHYRWCLKNSRWIPFDQPLPTE